MVNRNDKSRTGYSATPNDRGSDIDPPIVAAAYRQALGKNRTSIKRGSERLGVSERTIERYRTKGHSIPALRNGPIALAFTEALREQVVKHYAHAPAGYVARSHKRTVARGARADKGRRALSAKPPRVAKGPRQ